MELETQAAFDPASFEHIPVLLNECLEGLAIDPAGTYLDGTAGGAGHSRQIALRLDAAKGGRLISLDQDPDAVQTARSRLAGLPATVVQINFRYAGQALESLGIDKINGALLDLGVSSHQLDDAARGFSYRADAPLDMRMSQQGETAADLVNTESREELARILRDYGEEPFAWQIAGRIVEARENAPIETTLQLADIVASAMPPAERRKNKNPSRRTFQALRIAVNHELDALEEGLDTIFDHLAPGGRLCVITFHSLEDRLVKNKFRRWSTACTDESVVSVSVVSVEEFSSANASAFASLCSSAASFSAASDSVAASASIVSSTAVSELLSVLAFPQPASRQAARPATIRECTILVISLFFIFVPPVFCYLLLPLYR